jgi:hypothetical protein
MGPASSTPAVMIAAHPFLLRMVLLLPFRSPAFRFAKVASGAGSP